MKKCLSMALTVVLLMSNLFTASATDSYDDGSAYGSNLLPINELILDETNTSLQYYDDMGTGAQTPSAVPFLQDAELQSVTNDNKGIMWAKSFGGNGDDVFYSVTEVSDGIIAVGYSDASSYGTGDLQQLHGGGKEDCVLVKYDKNGTIKWRSSIGSTGNDLFHSVIAVNDGIIAAGEYYNSASSSSAAIIVKYSFSGDILWNRIIDYKYDDRFNSVTIVYDGIIAVGEGLVKGFGDNWVDSADENAIIAKYDFNGSPQWQRTFGGNGSDVFFSVTGRFDGYVAVGYSESFSFGNGDWVGVANKGAYDGIIVKYDRNGSVVWKKNLGGVTMEWDRSVTTVSDGFVAVGFSMGIGTGDWSDVPPRVGQDAVIMKYDNNGTLVWKNNFGGNGIDDFCSVKTVGSNVIASGYSSSYSFGTGDWINTSGYGAEDGIIVKYDRYGNVLEKSNYGGAGEDVLYGISLLGDGNYAAVGWSDANSFGNGDFADLWTKGGTDAIIMKNDKNAYSESTNHLENFNYVSDKYNKSLAMRCAEYSMLAYENFERSDDGKFVENKKTIAPLLGLRYELAVNHKFKIFEKFNYGVLDSEKNKRGGDDDPQNVSFVIASKDLLHSGEIRNLTTVIIRGTHGNEWQGNMDITGSEFDDAIRNHLSFESAKDDVKAALNSYINDPKHIIDNPIVLITGHSRGAAVANLLANDLNANPKFGIKNVYAYTFATPNNTNNPNNSTNIFNFCFNDDFVPQVPLAKGWGYSKHGIANTYTATAEELYRNNATFKNDLVNFLKRSNGRDKADFNYSETQNFLNNLVNTWNTTERYYNRNTYPELVNIGTYDFPHYTTVEMPKKTRYDFFRNVVAPAAMDADIGVSAYLADQTFVTIAGYFVDGGALRKYIFDTHGMFTYYTALKHDLFAVNSDFSAFEAIGTASIQLPSNPNADEVQKLKTFAQQGNNLANLDWDLDDISTWNGILWDNAEENRVCEINIKYRSLFGTLDLSGFAGLEQLDCSGNLIYSVDLTDCNSLIQIDCSNNYLSELAVPKAEIINCSFNKLTTLNISNAANLAKLYCNNNSLNQLNTTLNTEISDLYCNGNELTTLDLSTNTILTMLRCEDNHLDVQDGAATLTALQSIESKSTALVNYLPQKMSENPIFSLNDIAKLTAFANQGSNLTKLGWDLSKPQKWNGVQWILANNEYHAEEIVVDDLALVGDLNLSGMGQLVRLSCNDNDLIGIDVTKCNSLVYISANNTKISALNIANCDFLTIIDCENNYLDISSESALAENINTVLSKENSRVNYKIQKISASKSLFNQSEYSTLAAFANTLNNSSVLEWDIEKPGDWSGTVWELVLGEYRLKELSFECKSVTGDLDLSEFTHLTKLDCAMTKLQTVYLPSSLNKVENAAFYDCGELESVTIPNGIIEIGEDAFFNCVRLWNVDLGDTVISIEDHAFRNCISLTNIVLPESIANIGYNAFYGCTALKGAVFMGNAPSTFDQCAFENADNVIIYYFSSKIGFTTPIWWGYSSEALTKDINQFAVQNNLILQNKTVAGDFAITAVNTSAPVSANAIFAVYSGERLVRTTVKEILLNNGRNIVKFDNVNIVESSEEPYMVRIYLWNALDKIMPLTEHLDTFL